MALFSSEVINSTGQELAVFRLPETRLKEVSATVNVSYLSAILVSYHCRVLLCEKLLPFTYFTELSYLNFGSSTLRFVLRTQEEQFVREKVNNKSGSIRKNVELSNQISFRITLCFDRVLLRRKDKEEKKSLTSNRK
mmetsp:Transcript_11961/g.13908  ORF Transcript_11961/g.13908 Transcript_11961/m.13908 type:complete len:137 (-) Transcript_11961:137-547(-)